MSLLSLFEEKTLSYPKKYRELINRLTTVGGDGGSIEKKVEQGKVFSTMYEAYMYATILGFNKDEQMPFSDKDNFSMKVKEWKPMEMSRFIFMSALAKAPDLELIDLEDKSEEELDKTVSALARLIEEYACGGFSILQTKIEQNPDFYRELDFFHNLLIE